MMNDTFMKEKPVLPLILSMTLQPSTYETRDEGKTWYNITPKAK